jgi:hypothetical protein
MAGKRASGRGAPKKAGLPRKKPGADAGLKSSVMVGVFEEDDVRFRCCS